MELRRLRPVPDPLAGYIRVGSKEEGFITAMLVEGRPVGSGLVIEAQRSGAQADLVSEAVAKGLEVVLDPMALELSTPVGFTRSGVLHLPWAGKAPHVPSDLMGSSARVVATRIAEHVEEFRYSSVLAPTHIVDDHKDWASVDLDLAAALRAELDGRGLKNVPIHFRWCMRSATFADEARRERVMRGLANSPIDSIWLRVSPFGTSSSGPLALRRYIECCRALHEYRIPLVAEHTGTVGVALMAFGAVGGIESGVLQLERSNNASLKRAKEGKGFNSEAKIYLPRLGATLGRKKAVALLERPGMKSAQACMNDSCCPRGWRDMQLKYREHFVHTRSSEVESITAVPEALRAGWYMENFLRPASDRAVRASELEPSLVCVRKRLDQWRGTLGAELDRHSQFSVSRVPTGRRLVRSAS